MKKWQRCAAAAIFGTLGAVCCAQADDSTITTNQQDNASDYRFYRAQELSLDLFGAGSIGQQTIDHLSGNRLDHNTRLGAGAGVNYSFCRYLGIGGDAYTENTARNFVDSTEGNLIGRLPIGHTGLAPYVFGGGGYQFDEVAQKFAQAGGGVEFRFCRHVGVFVDARYVIADKTDNYGVGRAGLRFSF